MNFLTLVKDRADYHKWFFLTLQTKAPIQRKPNLKVSEPRPLELWPLSPPGTSLSFQLSTLFSLILNCIYYNFFNCAICFYKFNFYFLRQSGTVQAGAGGLMGESRAETQTPPTWAPH